MSSTRALASGGAEQPYLSLIHISSIYGMNFEYMPELEQPWGYPAVLTLMLVVALSLLIFMRRRRWF